MTYKIHGEAEVQTGFGLPRHTTLSRLAYTPPNVGYKVYDTDLSEEFTYTGTDWESTKDTFLPLVGGNLTGPLVIEPPQFTDARIDINSPFVMGAFLNLSNGPNVTSRISSLGSSTVLSHFHNGAQAFGGNLTLLLDHAEMSYPLHGVDSDDVDSFTTKGYVDGEISTLASASGGSFLETTGGTLTGDLLLNAADLEIRTSSTINPSLAFTQNTSSNRVSMGYESGSFSIKHSGAFFSEIGVDATQVSLSAGLETNRAEFRINHPGTGEFIFEQSGVTVLTQSSTGNWISPRRFESAATLSTSVDATLTTKGYVDNEIASFVPSGVVDLTTTQTIAGNKTFSDTTTVNNLIVNGTTTTINSTNTAIADNKITLNDGEIGSGVSGGTSGIVIDRGTANNQCLVFDDADDAWKVGIASALVPLATESFVDDGFLPLNGGTMTGSLTIDSAGAGLVLDGKGSDTVQIFRNNDGIGGFLFLDISTDTMLLQKRIDGSLVNDLQLRNDHTFSSRRIDMDAANLVPDNDNTLTTKSYVDGNKLDLTGGVVSGTLSMFGDSEILTRQIKSNNNTVINSQSPIRLTTDAVSTSIHPDDLINRGYVDTFLPKSGGTLTGDLTLFKVNPILSMSTATGGGNFIRMFSDNEAYRQAEIIGQDTRLLIRRPVSGDAANGVNDISVYDTYTEFSAEVRGVDSSNVASFTTKGYVDSNKLDLAGGTLTGQITIDANTPTILLDSSNDIGTGLLRIRNGTGLTTAEFFGTTSRALFRRPSLTGDHTDLSLFNTYVEASKEMRGVATTTASNSLAFTTKNYVDDGFVDLTTDQTIEGEKTFDSSALNLTPTTSAANAILTLAANSSGTTNLSQVEFRHGTSLQGVLLSNLNITSLRNFAGNTPTETLQTELRLTNTSFDFRTNGNVLVAQMFQQGTISKLTIRSNVTGGTSELELHSGTAGRTVRLASPTNLTSSYTTVMPASPPTAVGQTLQVGSISGQLITMVWA